MYGFIPFICGFTNETIQYIRVQDPDQPIPVNSDGPLWGTCPFVRTYQQPRAGLQRVISQGIKWQGVKMIW